MQRDPAIDSEGRKDITQAIADRTESLVVERVLMKRGIPVSLLGKMKALTESAQDFTNETHATLDGIAEKIAFARHRREIAAEKHHGYYDGIIDGVEESVAVIDRLSNGPLPEGGEGSTHGG